MPKEITLTRAQWLELGNITTAGISLERRLGLPTELKVGETSIEIEDDGTVYISCLGGDGHLKAREIIESITQPPEVGRIYENAKVVSVKDFGAFVEITPGVEGLCHISELSNGFVRNVDDVCKVGDLIQVKLILIDEQGRLKLSRKAALAELNKSQSK